jgi:hypothetical protein
MNTTTTGDSKTEIRVGSMDIDEDIDMNDFTY